MKFKSATAVLNFILEKGGRKDPPFHHAIDLYDRATRGRRSILWPILIEVGNYFLVMRKTKINGITYINVYGNTVVIIFKYL